MNTISVLSRPAAGAPDDTLVMRAPPTGCLVIDMNSARHLAEEEPLEITQVIERPAALDGPPPKAPPHASVTAHVLVAGLALLMVAGLGVSTLTIQRTRAEAAANAAIAQAAARGTRVVVVPAELLPPGRVLSLMGEVRPIKQVVLYAKVSGYLKDVRVDKGDAVTEGQILGVLESAEADQRIVSAQADYGLKARNARRSRELANAGTTSESDRDRSEADLTMAASELARVAVARRYATIRAPFDGVLTARYADPGALLQAATGSAPSSLALGELSDMRFVRIMVHVGQNDAPFVRAGAAVKLWTDADPTRRIEATITRTTQALDARTRTLECEIVLANPEGRFTPGGTVHTELTAATPSALAVPVEAVFVHQGRPAVMIVRDGRATLTPVQTGDHDGKRVRILEGIKEGELVALNAGYELANGARIDPINKPADAPGRR